MRHVKTVCSYQEFNHAIDEARLSHPDCTLVFRGQTHDQPLRSSMHRPDTYSDPSLLTDLNYSWHAFAAAALSGLGVMTDEQHLAEALLQHYGYRSWFLDVTYDPLIALWFALHSFKGRPFAFVDEIEEPHIIYSPLMYAYYERWKACEGFVYILAIPDSEVYQSLSDLVARMPQAAIRVHRQQAAAMLSTRSVDPSRYCVATLRITKKFRKHVFPSHISAQWLFPSPDTDPVYKAFVSVPFFVPRGKLNTHSIVASPLLFFPWYVHKDRKLLSEFQANLNLVPFQFYFLYEPSRANLSHSVEKTYLFRDAVPIYIPRIEYWNVVVGPPQEDVEEDDQADADPDIRLDDLHVWRQHGNNLFFELPLGAYLLHPFTTECNQITRGLLVLFGDNWIYITKLLERFGRRGSDFHCSPGMHFTLIDDAYKCMPMSEDCPCPNLQKHLNDELQFVAMLGELRGDGTLRIGFDSEIGYLVLKREGEPDILNPAGGVPS